MRPRLTERLPAAGSERKPFGRTYPRCFALLREVRLNKTAGINLYSMKHIVHQIHTLLLKNKQTIAVAESCTGGLISNLLTKLSGSSQYFILGVVAYSNEAKKKVLGVPSPLITTRGAVSKVVASSMAGRIRKIAHTDIGIGITGIAGPNAGTPHKPVGTVFIALDSKKGKICKKFHFKGTRLCIRKKAALKSLELLKEMLIK